MPINNSEKEYTAYIVDLMQSIGPVNAKHMFGAHGLFLDDLMFGLIADSNLYLKADKQSRAFFIDKGLEKFSYQKKGKSVSMFYYQAPEEALEDGEQMNIWANRAFEAALRAAK